MRLSTSRQGHGVRPATRTFCAVLVFGALLWVFLSFHRTEVHNQLASAGAEDGTAAAAWMPPRRPFSSRSLGDGLQHGSRGAVEVGGKVPGLEGTRKAEHQLHPQARAAEVVVFPAASAASSSEGGSGGARLAVADLCSNTSQLQEVARGLKEVTLACPGDLHYEYSVRVFNRRYAKLSRPALVARPASEVGVQQALQLAKRFGLQVTVRCGGHNPASLAALAGTLMIDTRNGGWNSIQVNDAAAEPSLTVAGGVLWDDVHSHMARSNWSYVGGGCPTVGVIGLALGGGIGWLSRPLGLVSDNVLSMRVVLANSSVVEASRSVNPQLFGALRGAGGSNFGVVSEMTIRLHPAQPQYLAGTLCLQVDSQQLLREVVAAWFAAVGDIDDDRLTVLMVMRAAVGLGSKGRSSPSSVGACLIAFMDGPPQEGVVAMQPLVRRLADLVVDVKTVCMVSSRLCHAAKLAADAETPPASPGAAVADNLTASGALAGRRLAEQAGELGMDMAMAMPVHFLTEEAMSDAAAAAAGPWAQEERERSGKRLLEAAAAPDGGLSSLVQQARRSLLAGEPWLQNHTFVSFSRSLGVKELYVNWKSQFFQQISPELAHTAAEALSEARLVQPPSRNSSAEGVMLVLQLQLEHLGGAIASSAAGPSAFVHRDAKLLISSQAYCSGSSGGCGLVDAAISQETERMYRQLEPFASGSYQNYADPEESDWANRYYGQDYPSLQQIKASVDGFSLFSTFQRIAAPRRSRSEL